MSKVKSIGLIVEDNSDFTSFSVLIKRIANKPDIKFKKTIGNGCGKIKKKALAWSSNLYQRGCNVLILVHDRDRNDLNKLRLDLELALNESPIKIRLICIPVEELEAWLISDPSSIKNTFNLKKLPKFKGLPETIQSPKEKLRESIRVCSDNCMIYLTEHNERIARNVSIELIRNKCPSFVILYDFINGLKF